MEYKIIGQVEDIYIPYILVVSSKLQTGSICVSGQWSCSCR